MGKVFDTRLNALGGTRLIEHLECDVDYEDAYNAWLKKLITILDEKTGGRDTNASIQVNELSAPTVTEWSKSKPFAAEIIEKVNLNGTGSAKETIHAEISLEGSGITYEPGDALGLKPHNCEELVNEILSVCNISDEEAKTQLTETLDITALSKKVVEAYAEISGSAKASELASDRKALKEYSDGREIIDLFHDFKAEKDISSDDLFKLFSCATTTPVLNCIIT